MHIHRILIPVHFFVQKGDIQVLLGRLVIIKWFLQAIRVPIKPQVIVKLHPQFFQLRLRLLLTFLKSILKNVSSIIIISYHFVEKIGHIQIIHYFQKYTHNTPKLRFMHIFLLIKVKIYIMTKDISVAEELSSLFVMDHYIFLT